MYGSDQACQHHCMDEHLKDNSDHSNDWVCLIVVVGRVIWDYSVGKIIIVIKHSHWNNTSFLVLEPPDRSDVDFLVTNRIVMVQI